MFSSERALVRESDAPKPKFGFIDTSGKLVIEPRFDDAYAFSENLAAVEIGFQSEGGKKIAGKWGYIDRDGAFVVPPEFGEARSFSEGLAEVSPSSGLWGYIDHRGKFVVRAKYSEVQAFSDGLAPVWPADGVEGYYIDKTGRTALTPTAWPQGPFTDGLTVAGKPGERVYLNRMGRVVAPYEIHPRYE